MFRTIHSTAAAARDAKHKFSKCTPAWQERTAAAAVQAARNTNCAAPPISCAQLKSGVLDGSIASAAYDTACTSHAGKVGDPFIQTEERSTKVFALANGHPTPATN